MKLPRLGIIPNTPIEPVIVVGIATILVALHDISYPAEAVPESRQSKIHRLEIFNDKYTRFVL